MTAVFTLSVPALAASPTSNLGFLSRDSVLSWIDTYRAKPEPNRLPAAVRTLSRAGVLKEVETSGFYVGFMAGVIGSNPAIADQLIARMLPLPVEDQWVVVRAVAFSGLPDWQRRLHDLAPLLPARQVMIKQYLSGKLPLLGNLELDRDPTWTEKVQMHFGHKPPQPKLSFANNPELLDTLWGEYFATGQYQPIWRILTMLPWSKDRDSVERLTVGSMAKVTLANNVARYPDLLAMLKEMAPYQSTEVNKLLLETIEAGETMQAPTLRKQALASIEDLKRKGPGYRRDVSLWSQVGQGAIAVGCIAAASASLTVFGLPCVIGGATASAAMNYWSNQQ